MKARTKWLILVVSIVVALVATYLYLTSGVTSAAVEKEVMTVPQVDFPLIVTATGVMEAGKSVSIGPPKIQGGRGMGGGESRFKLARIADEGKQVSEGDFLMEFDGSDIDSRLRNETANFQKEQQGYQKKRSDFDMQVRDLSFQVEQAKSDYEKIKSKLEGQVELLAAMDVAEQKIRLEMAKKNWETLERKLAYLKESGRIDLLISLSSERAYRNRMELLLDARDSLTVTSPVNGVVIYKRGWDGEAKQIGTYVFNMDTVIELPDLKTLKAKVMVDEIDANKINIGEDAQIQVQAVKGRLFHGKVGAIGAILKQASFDRPQKITEVMLEIAADNDEEDVKLLRPGMSAAASIQVGSYPKAIVIPLSSILERNGRSIVQVWNDRDKVYEWRDIQLATNDGLSAVVVSGLKANEKIRIKPKA